MVYRLCLLKARRPPWAYALIGAAGAVLVLQVTGKVRIYAGGLEEGVKQLTEYSNILHSEFKNK